MVITASFSAGRTALEVLERVLEAGVGIVQLREKDLGGREATTGCWNAADGLERRGFVDYR